MLNHFKKISFFISAVFVLTAVFFSDFAQASFWDTIRAWVTINPLEVDVVAPGEVEIDKVFQVEAKVKNKGREKIDNAKGEIFLPEGLTLLRKDSLREIGTIPGKKEKKISWQVRGKEIGTYIMVVRVSGELRGELISVEDSTKVEVKLSLPGKNLWQRLQDFLNSFKIKYEI